MWIVFLHASEDLRAIECWNYQHHGCRTQKWRPGRRSDCLNRKIARPSSTCRSQNVALHLASLSLFTLSFVFYFIYVNKRWSIFVDIIGCPALFVLAQIVQRILTIIIFCKWFIFSKSVHILAQRTCEWNWVLFYVAHGRIFLVSDLETMALKAWSQMESLR